MLTTFCANCGSALEEGAAFCPACGARARHPGAAYEQPYQEAYRAPQPRRGVPGRGKGIASLILGIIGVIYSFGLLMMCSDMGSIGFMFIVVVSMVATFSILALCLASTARQQGFAGGVSAAGLILGAIGLVMTVIALMMGFASMNA